MATTSGPSSRDVSPPLGPATGLPSKRDNPQPSLGIVDTPMRSNSTGNTNSPHPAVPTSEHGIAAGCREKGSSGRDMGQTNQNSSQNRKRQSVDGEEYPRRRAAIAVSIHSPIPSLLLSLKDMLPVRSLSIAKVEV